MQIADAPCTNNSKTDAWFHVEPPANSYRLSAISSFVFTDG
jgi:hypothetical protein